MKLVGGDEHVLAVGAEEGALGAHQSPVLHAHHVPGQSVLRALPFLIILFLFLDDGMGERGVGGGEERAQQLFVDREGGEGVERDGQLASGAANSW